MPSRRGDCPDHEGAAAIARCGRCSRGLCDACFRFRIDDKPGCARCAYEGTTRAPRRRALTVAFVTLAGGGTFWAARHFDMSAHHPVMLAASVVATPIVAAWLALGARADDAKIERREAVEDPIRETDLQGGGSPFRARVRRVIHAASPEISGRATALVVCACLVASAVLLPASVKLPRWIEAEIVLGLWWVTLSATLTALLYNDFRLTDDYVLFMPWDRPQKPGGEGGSSWGLSGCDGVDGCAGASDAEGCVGAIVVAVALLVAVGAAWVFVEVAMPVVFFAMYAILMRAIRRAARDHHDCAGLVGRSLGWGALWATIYVSPLAALTLLLHLAKR